MSVQPQGQQDQYYDDFFEGGGDGVPSFKFTRQNGVRPGYLTQEEQIGAFIMGTVVSQAQMDQTKMGTDEKILDDRGRVKQQLRVVLQTDLRNWDKIGKIPSDPEGNPKGAHEDTGLRAIYVKGWMKGAVADAIRAAGAPGLRPGGRLAVKVTELVPTTNGNPYAKYQAQYEAPAAGDQMFAESQPQQQAPVQTAPQPAPQPAPVQTAPQPAPQPAPVGAGWGGGAPAYDEPPF